MRASIDASSIILLAKANMLAKVSHIIKLETTPEVKAEVMKGLEKGKKEALYLKELARKGDIKISKAESKLIGRFVKDFNLGLGEASLLALATKNNLPVITDDNKARKVGKILGLKVLSSLNFPILLYKNKIIDYESAVLALRTLKRVGWFSEEVIIEAFNELKR